MRIARICLVVPWHVALPGGGLVLTCVLCASGYLLTRPFQAAFQEREVSSLDNSFWSQ